MTNCFFHLSCLQFLCWMADAELGLSDSSGWVNLDSVCCLWQKSLHAATRYAMLISYGCKRRKKILWSANRKSWLSRDQNFSISLWIFLRSNLRKQQGDFGKNRQLIQEPWLGTVPWKGIQHSPELHGRCSSTEQMMEEMQMHYWLRQTKGAQNQMFDSKCMVFKFIPVRREYLVRVCLIQPPVAVLCSCPSHSCNALLRPLPECSCCTVGQCLIWDTPLWGTYFHTSLSSPVNNLLYEQKLVLTLRALNGKNYFWDCLDICGTKQQRSQGVLDLGESNLTAFHLFSLACTLSSFEAFNSDLTQFKNSGTAPSQGTL